MPVFAASKPSAAMLSFFRGAGDIADVKKLTKEEIQVYGVFISNFYHPGMTLKDILSDDFADVIVTRFNLSNTGTVKQLNQIVYDSIFKNLSSEENQLVNSSGSIVKGLDLAGMMVNGNGEIYRGSQKIIDMNMPVFRGMWQLLATAAPTVAIEVVPQVYSFHIDGYGNIWGKFVETTNTGDITGQGITETSGVKLIVPGVINPLTFASEARGEVDLESLKLPLNNAFAMGSFVNTNDLNYFDGNKNNKYTDNLVSTYNLYGYLTAKDKANSLNIFGIISPNSDYGNGDNINASNVDLDGYLGSPINQIQESRTKIVLASNLGTSQTAIKNAIQNEANDTLDKSDKEQFLTYLYSTTVLDISKVLDTLYYFGEGTNEGWKDTNFASLGLLGASLFDDNGLLYGDNVAVSGAVSELRNSGDKQGLLDQYLDSTFTVYPSSSGYSMGNKSGLTSMLPNIKTTIKVDNFKFWFIDIDFNKTNYIYNMSSKDSETEGILSGDILYSDGGDINTFLNYHIYTLFSSHNVKVSGAVAHETEYTMTLGGKEIKYKVGTNLANEGNNWPGVFFAYLVDILSVEGEENAGVVSLKHKPFLSKYLPILEIDVMGNNFSFGMVDDGSEADKSLEDQQKELIKNMTELFKTSPSEYRGSLIKQFVNDILVDLHKSITGSNKGIATGETYVGTTGLVHLPSPKEMAITKWVDDNNINIYMLVMVVVIVSVVLMVVLNLKNIQGGILTVVLMSLVMILPTVLIGNTVNITNAVVDNIYSDKFGFWAMSEHSEFLRTTENKERDSKEFIIARGWDNTESLYSENNGVKLKWMAPKKDSVFMGIFSDLKEGSGDFVTNLSIFKWLFNGFIYDSEFVDDPLATYVYRSYTSLADEALEYKLLVEDNKSKINSKVIKEVDIAGVSKQFTLPTQVEGILNELETATLKSSYLNAFDYYVLFEDYKTNKMDNSRIAALEHIKPFKTEIGLAGLGDVELRKIIMNEAKPYTESIGGLSSEGLSDKPFSKLHLKNTESPYYYFYSVLANNDFNNFKNSLIADNYMRVDNRVDNLGGITGIQGTTKDFLGLEGLFTEVIPYLAVSNDYVTNWISVNGSNINGYDMGTVSTTDENYSQIINEQNHKTQMGYVWNLYSPWVEGLTDLYHKSAKVKLGTNTINITNQLNPTEYMIAGRPMVFGTADMVVKGFEYNNLTDVEIRIQRVLDKTYVDLGYLVNYYDLDNEVLLSAAAMYATFNFNQEFSDNSMLGTPTTLYPQGFEMKNFNYDAFIKLALLNATGEPLLDETDLVVRVLNKTSPFTGLILVLLDLASVYLIPLLKIMIIVGLVFLSILLGVAGVITPFEQIGKTILKILLLPTVGFALLNIVMAQLYSFMIGDGLKAYVGSQNFSMTTNDPTLTLLLMLAISILYSAGLIYIGSLLLKSYKQYGMSTLYAGAGLFKSGLGTLYGVAKKGISATTGLASNTVNTTASMVAAHNDGYGAMYGLRSAKSGNSYSKTKNKMVEGNRLKDSNTGSSGNSEAVLNKEKKMSDIDLKATTHSSEVAREVKPRKVNLNESAPIKDKTAVAEFGEGFIKLGYDARTKYKGIMPSAAKIKYNALDKVDGVVDSVKTKGTAIKQGVNEAVDNTKSEFKAIPSKINTGVKNTNDYVNKSTNQLNEIIGYHKQLSDKNLEEQIADVRKLRTEREARKLNQSNKTGFRERKG